MWRTEDRKVRRRDFFSHSNMVYVGHIKAFFSATRALQMVPQPLANSAPWGRVLHGSTG